MRNSFLFIAALVGGLLVSSTMNAQISLRFNFNLDRQPVWGPTGYDHVEYYYFPEIEAYYNVPQQMFFYNENGHWIGRSQLPARYHDFDFFHSYKVVLNERTPYLNHERYRAMYSSYRDRHDQEPIRDSRDSRYFVNKNHPEHAYWMRHHKRDDVGESGTGAGYSAQINVRGEQANSENSGAGTMSTGVDANINDQPLWGPTGYDHVDYYYIPDINSYYSVSERQYIYWDGSQWMQAASLPSSYSSFDPYTSYKVVINEPTPFWNNESHRAKYSTLKGTRDQPMIRDSRDPKYLANKDQPEHDNGVSQQDQDNGNEIGLDGGNQDDSLMTSPDDSLMTPQDEEGNDEIGTGGGGADGNNIDVDGSVSLETVDGTIGANIADQPMWGPIGYDRVDYYYLPDINSYYSVSERQYIYWDRSVWKHAASLPPSYSNYDPYISYKVVLNESNPYQNNESDKIKYGSFRGNRDQPVIRNSHDHKYFASKDHPEHATWLREHQR